ncbi:MAG: shikimate dehydrogenase [Desulfobacterales bacterium]|jgi:shikimate dehydrogenase
MIDARTSLFGLIGNPVDHSLSPVMHNQAFAETGCNAVYLAFCVSEPGAAIKSFRALNVKGVSVTLPHKVAVMEYLDDIEKTAASIGAVNTIVRHNGKLIGYNTDCQGAIKALQTQTTIDGKAAAIIGAGGAARAIGLGLSGVARRLTILNRTRKTGERLAADLKADFLPLEECQPKRYDIMINTTPVGMHPDTTATPIARQALSKEMVVMDIVYNPLNTRLLKEAAAKGCRTITGLDMFVFQGALQFELWTGIQAPVEVMRAAVLQALQTNF